MAAKKASGRPQVWCRLDTDQKLKLDALAEAKGVSRGVLIEEIVLAAMGEEGGKDDQQMRANVREAKRLGIILVERLAAAVKDEVADFLANPGPSPLAPVEDPAKD